MTTTTNTPIIIRKRKKEPSSSSPSSSSSWSSPRPRRCRRPIYVVVVESHQHVLEHIHTVLRKERLLTKEWSMIHFDSHPDLACPNSTIPAKCCFRPHDEMMHHMITTTTTTFGDDNNSTKKKKKKNLYEMLDSTPTGIAEWILPLVLAANLRNVEWIKPSRRRSVEETTTTNEEYPRPPSQLPLGIHEYQVGVSCFLVPSDNNNKMESFLDLPDSAEATVKVDWPHPYYLEDDCTVHYGNGDSRSCNRNRDNNRKEYFLFPQPLKLEITEIGSSRRTPQPPATSQQQQQQQQQDEPRKKDSEINNSISSNNNNSLPVSLSSSSASTTTPTRNNNNKDLVWSLDICLDYFACQNPFLTDLEERAPIFAKALLQVVYSSRFYSSDIMNTPTTRTTTTTNETKNDDDDDDAILQHYRSDLRAFFSLIVDLLKQQQQQETTDEQYSHAGNNEFLDKFHRFYHEPNKGRAYLEQLQRAFAISPTHTNNNGSSSIPPLTTTTTKNSELISMTEQALPNLIMPHHSYNNRQKNASFSPVRNGQPAPPSFLTIESIRPSLERVQEEIASRHNSASSSVDSDNGAVPFIITIARSSNDGFTPKPIVDELQDELIAFLHSIYCGCKEPPRTTTSSKATTNGAGHETCLFQMIFDYGPWEGSVFC